MKSLVLTFGIVGVSLLQVATQPSYTFSPESDIKKWEDAIKVQFAETDASYDYFVEYVRQEVDNRPYLFEPSPHVQLEPWCGDVLRHLTEKEKQSKMDLFVQSLCEVGNDYDEPSETVWRLLAALSKLSPEKLVPYAADILKQWGYIIHKDYQSMPERKATSDEEIQDMEEWLSIRPYLMEESGETNRTLDESQKKSTLQFPKGHFDRDVHPMTDEQFEVKWVHIQEKPDLELLRLSPYFLMFKHGKFLQLRFLYLYVWGILRQEQLIKGPGSVLEPVAEAYPFYFYTDRNIFGTPVGTFKSVWNLNSHELIGTMSVPFSLAVPLLHNDCEKLMEILRLHTSGSDFTADLAKKDIALLLYSMTQHFFPQAENSVSETLISFLGEPAFKRMKYLFFDEKNRGADDVFEHSYVKRLRNLVQFGENGQLEIAMVDIVEKRSSA
ncbi:hypothetical protein IWQ62_001523 [Dispira parvispora]|uniref:Uncharacterized protein n=1 Tax=Dispira parvispora TaxID=1520584 RepID=A0A9W8AVW6_9FUNG|nr:hypothetical protein IWQ62_001523 [Dispira parvispora]